MKVYKAERLQILLLEHLIELRGESGFGKTYKRFDKAFRRDKFDLMFFGNDAVLVDKERQEPIKVFKFKKVFMKIPL